MENKVALVKCDSYEQEKVDKAVLDAFNYLGGIQKFIKKGDKVALKINLVSKATPEKCVTTHPSVVEAVAKLIINEGANCILVDSPGGPYNSAFLAGIYNASGMNNVAKNTGAKCNDDFDVKMVEDASTKVARKFEILNVLEEADVIINLCKLKTHGFTGFTNAVKNMFGAIPGLTKVEMHAKFKTLDNFSDFLYDICDYLGSKLCLNICDAIIGMEGAGPTHGNPRKFNAIIASENPACLDVVGCKILGKNPFDMPTTKCGIKRGYLNSNMDVIVVGEKLENFVQKDVNVPTPNNFTPFSSNIPKFLQVPINKMFTQRPVVSKNKCRGCQKCYTHCPMKAIEMKPKNGGGMYASFDYQKCIRCFCCQELCPFGVVKIKSGFIYKILHFKKRK